MRTIILLTLLLFSVYSQGQNQEIQKVIETFFEAFHVKDIVKLKTLCDDRMILQSIAENVKGTQLSNEKPQAFFKSIASIPAELNFQEKIMSYSIQVDGSMAHAWTPYEFYVNGKSKPQRSECFYTVQKRQSPNVRMENHSSY